MNLSLSFVFLTKKTIILTFYVFEVFQVNVGVWGSKFCHIHTVDNNWNDIVVQHLEKLLSDIVSTEGVLERQVELVGGG